MKKLLVRPHAKRIFIFVITASVLCFLFCPRRFSWLFPMDAVTKYSYQGVATEAYSVNSEDVSSLRTAMDGTWVVWTGFWRQAVPDDADVPTASLALGSDQGLAGLFLMDKAGTIYKDGLIRTRYATLGPALQQFLESLE